MMKKRALELAAVVVVVAAVVSYSRGPQKGAAPAPVPLATGAAVAEGPSPASRETRAVAAGQTHEATALWKSLHDEAQAFLGQGNNDSAEARLVAALRLAPMAGPEALHETLDDLGLVCYRKGEYQRSADYQQRAIEAALKLGAPMSSATVGLYESRLALALHSLDQRENAIAAMGRAEEALREAYPEGSPAYSEAMNGLAAQYRSMGDNERAAKLL
jgi:tetratricopeptide (TPR) repeat protein